MPKLTVENLEGRVQALNEMMQLYGTTHKDYNQWQSSKEYYIRKLSYMDENDLQTIEI